MQNNQSPKPTKTIEGTKTTPKRKILPSPKRRNATILTPEVFTHQQRQTKSADDVMALKDGNDHSHPLRRNSDPIPLNQIHQQQQQANLLDDVVSFDVKNQSEQQKPQQFDNDQNVAATDVVVVESSEDEGTDDICMEPAVKRTKSSNDHVTTNGNHVHVGDDLEDFDNIISTFCEE